MSVSTLGPIEVSLTEAYDDEWFKLLLKTLSTPEIEGIRYPTFPDPSVQDLVNGSHGEQNLLGAYLLYRQIVAYADRHNLKIGRQTKILDFGCGWGRHLRLFWELVSPDNLHGVDIDEELLRLCKSCYPAGDFQLNSPEPPLPFESGKFDLIYAYSVFSHLNEDYNLTWMRELARITRPGGLLVLSAQGRSFIDFCVSLQHQPNLESGWLRAVSQLFPTAQDEQNAKAAYDGGKFLFFDTGGGGGPRSSSFYGEALAPLGFFQRHWSVYFDIVDFYDPQMHEQALVVARRR